MKTKSCEINHLDSDVLLPPRKRLLAGLKKQISEDKLNHSSTSCKAPIFEARLNSLMSSHLGNPNLSLEEAVEASRAAATSALELALKLRAIASDKAEIAAKAMTSAKKALDLVASISEDEENKEKYLKKNRIKKHLPDPILHKKIIPVEGSKTDVELAHNLHRAMNSSSRILKSSKSKRLKLNGNGIMSDVHDVRVDENTSKLDKPKVVENGEEAGTSQLRESKFESFDGVDSVGRKRGKMKQKS